MHFALPLCLSPCSQRKLKSKRNEHDAKYSCLYELWAQAQDSYSNWQANVTGPACCYALVVLAVSRWPKTNRAGQRV